MSLDWIDRVDGQADVLAADVNTLAHAIQAVEEISENLSEITNDLEEDMGETQAGLTSEETKRKRLEYYGDSNIEPSDWFDIQVEAGFGGSYGKVVGVKQGVTPPFGQQVIPYELVENGVTYPVEVIAENAFKDNTDISVVVLPKTITLIDDSAFMGSSLGGINLENVTEIEESAFKNVSGLFECKLPSNLNVFGGVIYRSMFENCTYLHTIHIPKHIESIQANAFAGCSNLGTVYFEGTKEQWDAISISAGNDVLENATIYYKYSDGSGGDLTNYYTKTETDTLLSAKASSGDVAASILAHNTSSLAHKDIRNKFKNADYYGDINIEPTDIFTIGIVDDVAYIGGIKSGATVPETVVVPAEYESGDVVYPVRYVYDSAILSTAIETLIFPNTITVFDTSACSGCTNLTTIVLAKGISFGNAVFNPAPLQNIYFRGTKSEWEAIPGLTAAGNENLATATKHYDYIPSLKNGYYTNTQTQSTVESAISTHNSSSEAHADIREDLTDLTNSIYESNTRELPLYSTNKVKLRLSQDQRLFSGTHNIISLYGIAQGAYTYGGVTITVTGNTVSIEGTATETWNYSFIDGIKAGPDDLSVYDDKPFPEGRYGISAKKISGNQSSNLPSLILKQKTAGNIVTLQNTTANIDYAYNTCGKIYTYIRSGITYDFTMVLGLFPYEIRASESYLYETSECEELQDGFNALKGYTWGSGITSIDELKEKTQKKMYVAYAQTDTPHAHTNELIYVLIPAKTGYVRITLGHTINTTVNANVWRIDRVDAIEDDMNTVRFPITTFGETEMALKIYGRDDFIGGSAHGDEIMDSANIRFVIDGQIVDITEHTTFEPVESFKLVRTSSMYDPSDSETKVGTHGVAYEFTEDGIELLQSIMWDGVYELDASYMPMVCAVRGNDSVSDMQITDTYIDDGNFIPYDVSEAGFTTYPYEKKSDVKKIMLGSAESGVLITYDIVEQTGDLFGQKNFLSNNAAYNKIYNAICGFGEHHTTVSGEKWRSRAKIKFEVGK